MKILYSCIFFLLIFNVFRGQAQDAHFSQYYASGLYLNPALSGTEPGLMAGINYRNQWRSIVTPYVTSQLSLIAPFYSGKGRHAKHIGGIGFSVYNDKSGDGNFRTTGVNINAAYNLNLSSKHTITFGVQGGFIQKSIDFANLQWGEQYNPYLGFDASLPSGETMINRNKLYPDIGAGAIYSFGNTKKKRKKTINGFVGFAAYHMNQPNESLIKSVPSKLPILYKGHGGLVIPLSKRLNLSPNILVMMQNNVIQYNGGMYLNYELVEDSDDYIIPSILTLGSWYRVGDSFIMSVGFGSKNYMFGFSYDFNNSSLRYSTQGRGAFEFSLSIRQIKHRDANARFHTPRI